ncbi:hypothetical protein EGW08_009432 [Elysia chlorotica]|uniref:Uncharacterized protein n=1 Tax=Elysia chlorotica TaxID=188477 RepID=A0A3S1BFJ9_ELYCH|nr:hypothetical protein EGW08_009432 [Elysia chlorotica]
MNATALTVCLILMVAVSINASVLRSTSTADLGDTFQDAASRQEKSADEVDLTPSQLTKRGWFDVGNPFEKIVDVMVDGMDEIEETIGHVGNSFEKGLGMLTPLQLTKRGFFDVGNPLKKVTGVVKDATNKATKLKNQAVESATNTATNLKNQAVNDATNLKNQAVENAADYGKGAMNSATNAVKNNIGGLVLNLQNQFMSFATDIIGKALGIAKEKLGTQIGDAVVDGMDDIGESIGKTVGNGFEKGLGMLKDGLEDGLETMTSFVG